VISRHSLGRHSVDVHRRAPPPAYPGDGIAAAARNDRFRRGVPSRSTLTATLGGDGGGESRLSTPRRRPAVLTDDDVVVVVSNAATSLLTGSRAVLADEASQMPQCNEQRDCDRRPESAMKSHIAPPRSSKPKTRSTADKRQTPLPTVSSSEQAKKGERLSNYNKGPVPPSRLRPLQPPPPPPTEVPTTVSSAVPQLPLNSRPGGVGLASVMDTLVEEPDESASTADLSRARLMNSPKQRSKLLQPLNFNSPNLRPRTQSMPSGTTRSAVGRDLRLLVGGFSPSSHRTTSPLNAWSDCNSPVTPNSANEMLPGSPLSVRIQKFSSPIDNDTRNYLFQFSPILTM